MSAPRLPGANLGLVAGLAQHMLDDAEFTAFLGRVLRAAGRRVGCGDLDGLFPLAALSTDAEHALGAAVTGLRGVGVSWQDIADRCGVTEHTAHTAHQRWDATAQAGFVGGAR